MDLRAPTAQQHPGLAPVDLALDPGRVQLRHERLTDLPERQATLAHIAADLALRDLRAVLGDQALPDPPRGVTLLARRVAIREQPRIDHLAIRAELRRRPVHRRSLHRRHRRHQRLPHRPPMHPMTRGQRPDREPLTIAIAPDLLERLHPGTHPSRPRPLELHELATVKGRSDGGGASSSVHTGPTSDVHTQAASITSLEGTSAVHRHDVDSGEHRSRSQCAQREATRAASKVRLVDQLEMFDDALALASRTKAAARAAHA